MAKAATLPETPDTAAQSNGEAPLPDPNDPNNQTVDITWRGVTVSVPKRRGKWDIDALVAFEDKKPRVAVKMLLGERQWGRIRRVAPTGDDFDQFSSFAADVINENCVA